jgi:hypothetical protein
VTYLQLSEQFEALLRDLPLESRGGAQALGEFVTAHREMFATALAVAIYADQIEQVGKRLGVTRDR